MKEVLFWFLVVALIEPTLYVVVILLRLIN
jgi:hypothetical protein